MLQGKIKLLILAFGMPQIIFVLGSSNIPFFLTPFGEDDFIYFVLLASVGILEGGQAGIW